MLGLRDSHSHGHYGQSEIFKECRNSACFSLHLQMCISELLKLIKEINK